MTEHSPHASYEAIGDVRLNLHARVDVAALGDVEAGFAIEVQQLREDMADLFRRLEYKAPPSERSPFIIDGRWASIAKTHFQQGIMALERAILRPKDF